MTTATAPAGIAAEILEAAHQYLNADHDHVPNAWGGHDIASRNGRTVRIALDDQQVAVHAFDKHMVLESTARFDYVPADVIGRVVAELVQPSKVVDRGVTFYWDSGSGRYITIPED